MPNENTSTCQAEVKKLKPTAIHVYCPIAYSDNRNESRYITFSETLLLLPLSSSGAIHGRVPRTPPVTNVFLFIFDKPKSPTFITKQREK